ncbi:VOC family protein [Pseudonocardia sp. CA-107938]|uniref:VOC family protein n=1 Tax=Pseudonocardia sp. CA-107938 TaxID=3240021 RepID=UPI003D8CF98B
MTATLQHITFDCDDALAVATFWSATLDRDLDPDGSRHFASIGLGGAAPAPAWLFVHVPERKSVKNRTHVDLSAPDPETEIERLVGLGAVRIADVEESGARWTVLHDPEGNEFCMAQGV